MSFQPQHRSILVSTLPLLLAATLGGCGQKGPLYIPDTPAAAQRATLPQTVWGGTRATPAAPAASSPTQAMPPPALPNLPDIE
ncbi:MAG: lipoprotein [Pseudomonadota bacterium]|nr:lipoprotein [Pseudomonadota bacterium]